MTDDPPKASKKVPRKRPAKVTRTILEDALGDDFPPWPRGWVQDVLSYNIRMRAAEAGLSQTDLAAASGITTKQIRAIENRRVDPKLTTLEALAQALDCRVPDLLMLPPTPAARR
jgi:DNA-binding XRE family transcriptional regulator